MSKKHHRPREVPRPRMKATPKHAEEVNDVRKMDNLDKCRDHVRGATGCGMIGARCGARPARFLGNGCVNWMKAKLATCTMRDCTTPQS